MVRRNLNDLLSFVTVAREGSFTRAAAVAGCDPIGTESGHQRPGGETRDPPADPYHPQRVADGGRGAAAAGHRTSLRRDRSGVGGVYGASRQARRHGPHHLRRPCASNHAPAEAYAIARRLSGHQGRVRRELRIQGHRRRSVRRGRADGRHDRQGHDCRADRSQAEDGRCRLAGVLREAPEAEDPEDLTSHSCINMRFPTQAACTSGNSNAGASS